jgi:hypothetical protein
MSGVEIFEQRAGVSVASSAVPVGSEVRKVAPFEVGARLGSSVEKRDRGYWAQRRSSDDIQYSVGIAHSGDRVTSKGARVTIFNTA